jgi:hypothetical protein
VTKDELAVKLNHLDPGATLPVEASVLASLFGAGSLSDDTIKAVEEFALNHRCIFSYQAGRHPPLFEKEDIF